MTRVRVGEISLDYELRGQGPPLLMVCGYRRNRSVWGEALLAPLAEVFTLVLFDNRGTGNSDQPPDGYSVANFARDGAGLLEALEIPRAHVFGVSMGGMIAQTIAADFPAQVSAVAIGCSSFGGKEAVPTREEALKLLRILPSKDLELEQLAFLQLPAYFTETYRKTHADFLRDFFRVVHEIPTPDFAVKGHLAAIEAFDGAARLGAIRAPALVITGADDLLIPAENSKMLAERIAGAELKIFSDSGHFFWLDHGAETAQALIDFFSRVRPA